MNQDLVELKMRILEAVAEGDNVLARAELGAAADLAHAAGQPSTELLLTGVNSYLNGEYAAAGATLEEALRLAPDDPDILDFLGNVESALGLTWASCDEIAESRYTRAIVMRIKVARDQADGAGTEKAARQARNLFEENWRSYYFIGRNLNLVGRHV
jgi:tetratricopeptide (TPR) repeat protein